MIVCRENNLIKDFRIEEIGNPTHELRVIFESLLIDTKIDMLHQLIVFAHSMKYKSLEKLIEI